MARTYFIIPHLHPLFYGTLALMAGIAFSWTFSLSPVLAITIPIASVATGYFYRIRNTLWAYAFFLATFFILGISAFAYQQWGYQKFMQRYATPSATIRATIESIDKIQHPRFSHRLTIVLQQCKIKDSWHQCSARVLVYTTRISGHKVGDIIELAGVAIKPIASDSFRHYVLREGAYATLFVAQPILKISRPSWSWGRFTAQLRSRIYTSLQRKIKPNTFQLVSSIFLGNRNEVKSRLNDTKEDFKRWGISHYLARSGLHVVIFILIWQFFLALLPIARWSKYLFLFILIFLYSLLSWSSVSFERAVLMFLLSRAPAWMGYATHYLHVLSLATCIILLLNPLHLFFLDFQLSFGFTAALAWLAHIGTEKRKLS